ncbi:hypothetical protein VITU102760_13365 [Vibrio tubiashii]
MFTVISTNVQNFSTFQLNQNLFMHLATQNRWITL